MDKISHRRQTLINGGAPRSDDRALQMQRTIDYLVKNYDFLLRSYNALKKEHHSMGQEIRQLRSDLQQVQNQTRHRNDRY